MSRRLRILVDMDETCVAFMPALLAEYNRLSGDTLTMAACNDWSLANIVKSGWESKIYDIFHQPRFFDNLQPLPGALEVIQRLSERHDVRIATSAAGPDSARAKLAWLKRYLGWGKERAFICADKHWIDCDWIVDDKPSTIMACAAAGRRVATIWYPYNVVAACTDGVFNAGYFTDTASAWRRIEKEIG